MAEEQKIKQLVRIANADLIGTKHLLYALRNIKGVGSMFANAICKVSKMDEKQKVGLLSNDQIKKIEEILNDPLKFKIPVWMLNRRKERESGEDKHFTTTKLHFAIDDDIKLMKKIKCYKGIRHMFNLPVRGQKTRSHFRKNKGKGKIGVKKVAKSKTGK